jgi:hypothetical protein
MRPEYGPFTAKALRKRIDQEERRRKFIEFLKQRGQKDSVDVEED